MRRVYLISLKWRKVRLSAYFLIHTYIDIISSAACNRNFGEIPVPGEKIGRSNFQIDCREIICVRREFGAGVTLRVNEISTKIKFRR